MHTNLLPTYILFLWFLPISLWGIEKPTIGLDFKVDSQTNFQENFSSTEIDVFTLNATDSLTNILNDYIGLFQFVNENSASSQLHVRLQTEEVNGDPFQPHVLLLTFSNEGNVIGTQSIPFLDILEVMEMGSIEGQSLNLGNKFRDYLSRNHTALVKKLFSTISLSNDLLYLGVEPKPQWVLPFREETLSIDRENSIFWIRIIGSDAAGARDEYPVLVEPFEPYTPDDETTHFLGCMRAKLTSDTSTNSKDADDIDFTHEKYHLFIFKYARKKESISESPSLTPTDLWNLIEPSQD